ncbi:hypothetical protein JCM11491_006432 [Sporobolomyces phaffii]
MSAEAWATEILGLPLSSRGTSIKANDLPAPSTELAQAWCDELARESATEDTRKIILRALRASRLLESHDLILRTTSPLLLSNSPSIRLQAAGNLLVYASMSSSHTLENRHEQIISTIDRALSPMRVTIHSNCSPSSSSRFVSTCFRILNTLVPKLSVCTSDNFDVIVSLVASWLYHGPSPGGSASPAPNRGRGGPDPSQLSFGIMSSFAQTSVSPRKRPATGASRTSSSERDGASESESEDKSRDRRAESAHIRVDALTCLRALAKSNARGLQKHWHHFLSDSPYLRNRLTLMTLVESDPARDVRLQACRALEAMLEDSAAYLNIAQDRPKNASFTSLSTKVGEIVGELHLSLTALLDKPRAVDQIDLRLAILCVARRLAICSPYGRMSRSLAGPLTKSVSANAKDSEPTVVEAAYSTLTVIARRCASPTNKQTVDWNDVVEAALDQLDREVEETIEIAIWGLLTAAAALLPEREWTVAMSYAGRYFKLLSPALQSARVRFLVSYFPPSTTTSIQSPPVPPGAIFLLQSALSSRHPTSRALACSALSHPSLAAYPDVQPLRWAHELSSDPCAEVSQAARRVLGLVLRDSTSSPSADQADAVQTLMREFCEDVNGDLCWALANACDSLNSSDAMSIDLETIVDRAMQLLLIPRSDETIRISCLRILGSMLKIMPSVLDGTDGVFQDVLSTFCDSLESNSAKIRWNTCTSLYNALPALSLEILSTPAFTLLFTRLVAILVEDPSYKVRIHAVSTLSRSLATAESEGISGISADEAREAGQKAREQLQGQVDQGQVQAKERNHVGVLLAKLDAFLLV